MFSYNLDRNVGFISRIFLSFLAISGDIKISKNVMRFPSIYVFTLFLIPSLNGEQEDDFCKITFEEEYPSFSCEKTTLTNLTKESGK